MLPADNLIVSGYVSHLIPKKITHTLRVCLIADLKYRSAAAARAAAVGLALARMIGHITYLSREAMREKFETDRFQPRDVAVEFEKKFSVGSYLGYQGAKFVERFDANSYVTLSLAMDLIDMGSAPQELARALAPVRCRWLIVSFSSDWLFPPDQSRDIVNALIANRLPVSYCKVQSGCGHDAFLLPNEIGVYGAMMKSFLENLCPCGNSRRHPEHELHGPTSIFHQHRLDYDHWRLKLIPLYFQYFQPSGFVRGRAGV